MKLYRIIRCIKKPVIRLSQIFGRKRYMRVLCWCNRNTIIFDPNRLPRYISSDVEFDQSATIYLGGVTIAAGTSILTHDYSVDYGLIAIGKNDVSHEKKYSKEVRIGEDSFIGQKCLILPGVSIGRNCIIGAGSLVNKDIPDNSVAAGVPAKIIDETKSWIIKRLEKDSEFIS